MDHRARRERESRRLLDLAADCGFDRNLAASCLARLLELYGAYPPTTPPPPPPTSLPLLSLRPENKNIVRR